MIWAFLTEKKSFSTWNTLPLVDDVTVIYRIDGQLQLQFS